VEYATGQEADRARANEREVLAALKRKKEADAITAHTAVPLPDVVPVNSPVPDRPDTDPPPDHVAAVSEPTEPRAEGTARRIAKDLVTSAGALVGVPSHYVAHVGRGKWQDTAIEKMYRALSEPANQGRVLMLTIDMKSKTETGKHREPQGHGFGGRGMSLQGGMVDLYWKGETRTFYVDLIYEQSSNQKVEEAMCGLQGQLEALKKQFPTVEEVWICSDKCSNFNAYEQVPFIS
jgi:hypothetical protein